MNKLKLIVYTPEGKKFEEEVDFIQVHSSNFYYGILPGHIDLVSDVVVSKVTLRNDGIDKFYAVGEGVMNVSKDVVKLIVDTFESKDEIDLDRATSAKNRAESRLEKGLETGEELDVKRAKAALARALNRINVFNS